MASRHQRRKRAKAKAIEYANRSTQAKFSDYVAETTRRNLSSPKPERSFAPSSVDLVQRRYLGSSRATRKRTAPYTKHSAGQTPMAADYALDSNLKGATERYLRRERAKDRLNESPAVNWPIVERDA